MDKHKRDESMALHMAPGSPESVGRTPDVWPLTKRPEECPHTRSLLRRVEGPVFAHTCLDCGTPVAKA